MSKKIVHYSNLMAPPVVGSRAFLYPIDHPDHIRVSNQRVAVTSPIVAVRGDEIETENTIYRLKK